MFCEADMTLCKGEDGCGDVMVVGRRADEERRGCLREVRDGVGWQCPVLINAREGADDGVGEASAEPRRRW